MHCYRSRSREDVFANGPEGLVGAFFVKEGDEFAEADFFEPEGWTNVFVDEASLFVDAD